MALDKKFKSSYENVDPILDPGNLYINQLGHHHHDKIWGNPRHSLRMLGNGFKALYTSVLHSEEPGSSEKSYNGIRAARYNTTPYGRTRLILCLGCCQFGVLKVKASLGPAHSGVTGLD